MFIVYVIKNGDIIDIKLKDTLIEAKKSKTCYISHHLKKTIGTERAERILELGQDDEEYRISELNEENKLVSLLRTKLIRTPGLLWGNHKHNEVTEEFRIGIKEQLSTEEIRKANLKELKKQSANLIKVSSEEK